MARHRFFGRETVSFLLVLPIALPGIVTGVAFSNTFTQVLGVSLSLLTVIVATRPSAPSSPTTARSPTCGRVSGSFKEASANLGAHTWQTFRYVTLPSMRTALVAGALLSFDEIIVTTFTETCLRSGATAAFAGGLLRWVSRLAATARRRCR